MDRFGTDLLRMFAAKAFPRASGPAEIATWDDVVKIFFELAKKATLLADETGRYWTVDSIKQFDLWLMETAETGNFDGTFNLPAECAEEYRRRCVYAVVAGELELRLGRPLDMPFPSEAPDAAKGWGLMLYLLGGPARDYDPAMFK